MLNLLRFYNEANLDTESVPKLPEYRNYSILIDRTLWERRFVVVVVSGQCGLNKEYNNGNRLLLLPWPD